MIHKRDQEKLSQIYLEQYKTGWGKNNKPGRPDPDEDPEGAAEYDASKAEYERDWRRENPEEEEQFQTGWGKNNKPGRPDPDEDPEGAAEYDASKAEYDRDWHSEGSDAARVGNARRVDDSGLSGKTSGFELRRSIRHCRCTRKTAVLSWRRPSHVGSTWRKASD